MVMYDNTYGTLAINTTDRGWDAVSLRGLGIILHTYPSSLPNPFLSFCSHHTQKTQVVLPYAIIRSEDTVPLQWVGSAKLSPAPNGVWWCRHNHVFPTVWSQFVCLITVSVIEAYCVYPPNPLFAALVPNSVVPPLSLISRSLKSKRA